MKQGIFTLTGKRRLNDTGSEWLLEIEAPEIEASPGRFVNIMIEGHYLRRPISVSYYKDGILNLIVNAVGGGTRRLVETPIGRSLDMLTGLGNCFSVPTETADGELVVIGGGIGFAPLVGLLKKISLETDIRPLAVFGFNEKRDVPLYFLQELAEETGCRLEICTMKGDFGRKGNAVACAGEILAERSEKAGYFYACGPMGMMKAACSAFESEGELSLEARMGCGFGACVGCSIRTTEGIKRICKEGPVFKKSELEYES